MSLRTDLTGAMDAVDQVLGPAGLDLQPTKCTIVTVTWSGGRRRVGDSSKNELPLPPWITVRQVKEREIATSGGRLKVGDVIVGPIRPSFTRADGSPGGFSEAQLNPPGQEGVEIVYKLEQTDTSGSGFEGDYALVEFRRDNPFFFELVLRRRNTTPL